MTRALFFARSEVDESSKFLIGNEQKLRDFFGVSAVKILMMLSSKSIKLETFT